MLETIVNKTNPFVILPLSLGLDDDDKIEQTVIFYREEYSTQYKILSRVSARAIYCILDTNISDKTFTIEDRQENYIILRPVNIKSLNLISSYFRVLPRYSLFTDPYYLMLKNELIAVSKFYIENNFIIITEYCRGLLATSKKFHERGSFCFFGKIKDFDISSKNSYLYVKFVKDGAFLWQRMEKIKEIQFPIIRPKIIAIPPAIIEINVIRNKCQIIIFPRDFKNPAGAGIYPNDVIVPTHILLNKDIIIRYKFLEIDIDWNILNDYKLEFEINSQTSKIAFEFVNIYEQTQISPIVINLPTYTEKFNYSNFISFNILET